jgi:two-component system, OmpR family, phosphate regulon sensor histidine kinase PhoR
VDLVAADFGRAVQHARLFRQQSALVGQLRELDRTKSDFLSTISHELRTPLTSIVGYVEMLRDGEAGELRPRQRNMLDVVGRNAQRLQDLIEDLLMISRVESGAVRSERMPVALAGVVDQVVSALRPQAEEGGVRIDVFPVPAQALLLADPVQMDRMLLNLVGNAVKFTPDRGRVGISVQVGPEQLVLRVDDTGIGVPAAELPSLFNRFFRASNATTRQIPGTGLGLAIVGGIVAAHDGRVEVDSVEGRGTTFTVTLPRWDPDVGGRDG